MRVNQTLCNEIVMVWENALTDGLDKSQAIQVLSEVFKGQNMTEKDVQFLYQTHQDARYFECGVTTRIYLDN
jgi:hypothetical protein